MRVGWIKCGTYQQPVYHLFDQTSVDMILETKSACGGEYAHYVRGLSDTPIDHYLELPKHDTRGDGSVCIACLMHQQSEESEHNTGEN